MESKVQKHHDIVAGCGIKSRLVDVIRVMNTCRNKVKVWLKKKRIPRDRRQVTGAECI